MDQALQCLARYNIFGIGYKSYDDSYMILKFSDSRFNFLMVKHWLRSMSSKKIHGWLNLNKTQIQDSKT